MELPNLFYDLTGVGHADAVAWLRFIEEEDGSGIWAALFETSGQGDPLAFCFTRMDRRDPSLGQRDDAGQVVVTALVKTLFQAASRSPVLIIGLADEMPPDVFNGDIQVRVPFCRVRPVGAVTHAASQYDGPADGNPQQLLWATAQPAEGSDARVLLDEIMEQGDPFEPFQRAGGALAEAFADQRVHDMAAVFGLTSVVSLSSLPLRPEHLPNPSSAGAETALAVTQEDRPGLTLAERLWRMLAAPASRPRNGLDVRLTWAGELMPFQQDGVQALLNSDRLLLADDMGLGKTVQAIAALRILRARGSIKSCLVAAPASLLGQWRREIDKWAPELSAIIVQGAAPDRVWQWDANVDVTLVSYETLRSDFGGSAQSPLRRKTWDVVVADEAQRIKNRNDTSDAVKGLQRVRSWALTGTPVENDEEELASIVEFVDYDGSQAPKHHRPGVELRERHQALQLRRKKGEVLDDLPPKQVTKLAIDLHPKQRSSYLTAEEEGIVYLKSLGAEVRVRHVLELITRLKEICNADPQSGASSKLEDIKERLEHLLAQGHRALVFSQYTSDAYGVAAAVNYLREFNPLSFTGELSQEERAAVIDRFKAHDDHKVLVLSLRAGGLGLNLQEASYVFHLDRWWNPAVERQAEDRSHRMGQAVKVNVIKYSCAGTIEERIDRILEGKQGLFDQLVDDVSLDLSTQLSREELLSLFGL